MNQDGRVQFRLSTHGDSLERKSANFLSEHVPAYEPFWKSHIVPLTFRVVHERLNYVRPSLGREVLALANSSYATMHHLVWANYYRTTLEKTSTNARYQRTELLYCFFSHARSCVDALGYFAEAVDRVSQNLGMSAVFNAVMNSKKAWTFFPKYDALFSKVCIVIGKYRNTVVHECPVYLVRDVMPVSEHLEEYKALGLASLANTVRNGRASRDDWVPVSAAIDKMFLDLVGLANEWWSQAEKSLDRLPRERYMSLQSEGLDRDRELSPEKFEAFLMALA